ncbi:fumarylacetoacetate hydrolase family protein [Xanthomonas oryzae pv. oryzae]|uniref:2-keto-4-pentenoate hydratase/2-oxohepta-3-ene-1,7-dioic acid hydratase (Catechol pathway) n=3 Tax=Xanthomonas oryzae pv. oryzae TaxID=64187 RepID=Q5GU33_XANOR|nr:fumarylacetoacetate hydrolase family protein [Xanthomonas oryzae]AAW77790.1 2-keto-4-pentenoate hydratase/2-oxohepta-3-ene-1,7-dioic acid hydratase (catechol pathway) [Xanthomonas oryzae pv. oryzae KACC 10331]ACD61550.1 2-hydroxyhepta-2,4-diene-1, 7-dioateisomerase/5-carboxymethyl-2-oxo-hex-3-ene-1, 7-dioatedecarboxylase [Xanthomonas oryzae pv. oryzae PXO99A]AJQ85240.1 2-hydroxyhepta-2,4-diene-1,7-dioate isomerase [Xanthomonas oryzae pv. oryzae PXO86]ALZ73810.1 2-hydroxyhepta-2,4-diene-1,7-d
MKLVRIGAEGHERPGLIDSEGRIRDLSGVIDDVAGQHITNAGLEKLRVLDVATLPLIEGDVRYGAAVGRIGKFICVGLNYADHAAESGMEVPKMPILFMKATTAVCGPNDTVIIPRGSVKSDWEVELGVVIGDVARDVSVDEALNHVAGYAVINDLSEREFQLEHGGQWVKGKSADTFGPIGPWLVTRDEIADPQNLSMWLEVNGHRYQNGSTRTMVFGVAELVSHISRYMTLMPGDVISTGTPPGVGLGQKPPVYLKPGDVMELEIEGLGRQRQPVVAHPRDGG